MGTFVGHVVPGMAFTILGLWHTLNTIKSYKLKGPPAFSSTTWFPFPYCKHLELYLLISLSVIAAVLQLLDYPLFSLAFKPVNFEHATMFLHVVIYATAALAADLSPSADDALSGVLGALAASAFGQELFLLHFHSADHAGLEGHYHWLLQLIVAVSLLAAVATAGAPRSFVAAVARSGSVLFQGVWFVVMGFALWVPSLVPKGCYSVDTSSSSVGHRAGAVACEGKEAGMRAEALANLQFSWTLAGVCILISYLCVRAPVPEISKSLEYTQLQLPGSAEGLKRDINASVL